MSGFFRLICAKKAGHEPLPTVAVGCADHIRLLFDFFFSFANALGDSQTARKQGAPSRAATALSPVCGTSTRISSFVIVKTEPFRSTTALKPFGTSGSSTVHASLALKSSHCIRPAVRIVQHGRPIHVSVFIERHSHRIGRCSAVVQLPNLLDRHRYRVFLLYLPAHPLRVDRQALLHFGFRRERRARSVCFGVPARKFVPLACRLDARQFKMIAIRALFLHHPVRVGLGVASVFIKGDGNARGDLTCNNGSGRRDRPCVSRTNLPAGRLRCPAETRSARARRRPSARRCSYPPSCGFFSFVQSSGATVLTWWCRWPIPDFKGIFPLL